MTIKEIIKRRDELIIMSLPSKSDKKELSLLDRCFEMYIEENVCKLPLKARINALMELIK